MYRKVLSRIGSSGAWRRRSFAERSIAPVSHSILCPGWRFAYPGLLSFDPFRVFLPILLIIKVILF